jgi:hypothetical protein
MRASHSQSNDCFGIIPKTDPEHLREKDDLGETGLHSPRDTHDANV